MSKDRIPMPTAIFMWVTAVFYDGLQFLLGLLFVGLVVNSGISVLAWLHFYIWCKIRGISFTSPSGFKRAASLSAGGLVEMIPFFNMFPTWTLVITGIIFTTWKEDRLQREQEAREESAFRSAAERGAREEGMVL